MLEGLQVITGLVAAHVRDTAPLASGAWRAMPARKQRLERRPRP